MRGAFHAAGDVATLPWWQAGGAPLARLLSDLILSEARRLRPGGPSLPRGVLAPELALDEAGLGLDSLELLSTAASVTEALHLHESGIEDYLLARRRFGDWLHVAAEGLARVSARLTFRSSGSTGEPTRHTHALAALEAEAAGFAALLPGRRRLLAAVPAHHIYGFIFTLLLPRWIGDAEVLDLRPHSPGAAARLLRPGDLVIGHPAWWGAVSGELPPDVVGVTSTAPCPDATAHALRRAGLARLLQVYGSSETSGIGWREDPAAPFRLLPAWRRGAEEDALLRRIDGGEQVAAPDRLCWEGPDRFRIAGRHDSAVQVGGINVHPGRVRAVLEAHPDVAAAAVRLMRPEEGSRLKAFIVPRDPGAEPEPLLRALVDWVGQRLAAPERPRAWTLGPALPQGEMGKPADWAMPAALPDIA